MRVCPIIKCELSIIDDGRPSRKSLKFTNGGVRSNDVDGDSETVEGLLPELAGKNNV